MRVAPAELGGHGPDCLEKITREVRGSQADPTDLEAVQRRNRKLQRLNQVANLVSNFRSRYRR